ncbi:hypothetical protein EYF80_024715 [Liparis tanakae]|uniref:Uncharacterized protein n=1 Tax=Liparis tanakae TaxID=230148 RepID=A0A4Z2HH72_9TELE|nr:hypothetical protein EYF80_024715 [Liparis tanakae]
MTERSSQLRQHSCAPADATLRPLSPKKESLPDTSGPLWARWSAGDSWSAAAGHLGPRPRGDDRSGFSQKERFSSASRHMMDERADRPEQRAGTGRRRWTPQRVLTNAVRPRWSDSPKPPPTTSVFGLNV